jgi:hypothetical protein
MSEHTELKGNINYIHQPYQENGFSFCKRCRKFVTKASITFHEGFCSEWCEFRCEHCKHVIWVCEFGIKEDGDEVGIREMVKDDQKCSVCGKKTNHYDCIAYGGKTGSKKNNYWCSKKCYDKANKEERKQWEKQKK